MLTTDTDMWQHCITVNNTQSYSTESKEFTVIMDGASPVSPNWLLKTL